MKTWPEGVWAVPQMLGCRACEFARETVTAGAELWSRHDHGLVAKLNPEEIASACVGELYRYRLALQDQRPRIDAATKALRAERERIERDEHEHLFAPSASLGAWMEELESIHRRDIPEIWRLKSEAQFLLVAVYGILSMSRAPAPLSPNPLDAQRPSNRAASTKRPRGRTAPPSPSST